MPVTFYFRIAAFLLFLAGGSATAVYAQTDTLLQGTCTQDSQCVSRTCVIGNDGTGICASPYERGTPVPTATFGPSTNTQSFSGLICNVTNLFTQQLLPPLAVLMMLVVGFFFLVSGGDPGRANTAKKAFFFVLIGTALLVLAPGIVALLSNLFGGFSIAPLSCQGSVAADVIVNALVKLVNWFSWFIAITSVVMGLYAGYLYMTAGGNAQRVVQASRVLSFTIIGVAVAVVAFSIIAIVRTFLG